MLSIFDIISLHTIGEANLISIIITSIQMKQQDSKHSEVKKIMTKVLEQVDEVFRSYKQKVQRKNYEQNGGILHKNQKSEKIYSDLVDISKQLKNVEAQLKDCEKLRKQRKVLFQKKTTSFLQAINQLITKKNIKIKINPHLGKLTTKSKEVAAEALTALKHYKTESSLICGKAYDYKPMVEKTMLQMAELGFLWENLASFQSITNQSVKQIYIPIDYKPADFNKLEAQILKAWPEPVVKYITKQPIPSQPPPPPLEPTQIVSSNQLQLAHQYLFGFIRPQQISKAVQIYQRQAAKVNPDPSALNALGTLNQQGKGFAKDLNKAFRFFMKSAEKGDPEGLYKVGQYLEKGLLNFKPYFDGLYANRDAEVRGGIQYYQKAGGKGHLDALTDLGFIYEKGVMHQNGSQFFIPPHPQHAKKYYQKAKLQQFPRAFNNLGNLLICQNTGNGNFSQNANLQKGIKYLSKARQLGCHKASINLGKCYLSGTGVPRNLEQARALFKQAAQLGQIHGRLQYIRSYIGTNLQQEETMSDLADSARIVLMQNRNNPQALFLMGLLEQKGIGVAPNKETSYHYVASAARFDYPPALTRLADYYYSGYYIDKNYENARILYEKAAAKGDSQAYLNLALMEEKGLIQNGCSLGSADELYKKAEELGNTNALLIRGLKKQINLSKNQQVLMAAGQGNSHALKMLTQNDVKYTGFIPKNQNMQKMSTFYMKETLPPKRKFNSLI